MDILDLTLEYLCTLPLIQEWPVVQQILHRTRDGEPRDWLLPLMACEAVGGASEQAIPAAAAIACAQISIILIDDMLDADPRGEYLRIGKPRTANLASVFQALGICAILQSETHPKVKVEVAYSLSLMMLATGFGQFLDIQNPDDEMAYWELVRAKSSPFFGAALQAGALIGETSSEIVEQVKRFGWLYGEMIQIHDDLNDAMALPANPDWLLERASLPILFAKIVDHPDRERFLELRASLPDPDTLLEAQEILIRCGALSYCVDQLLQRYQAAQALLTATPLVCRDSLENLLADVVDPIRKMFASIDVPQPGILIDAPL